VSEVPPLLLASSSPHRRAILEQLGLPFDVVEPDYVEHDPPDADPELLVRRHSQGKARSVLDAAAGRPVVGVDTTVVLGGRVYAKAADADEAVQMLLGLSGKTHAVVSGVCLATPEWEVVDAAATCVTFRELAEQEVVAYVTSGEWEGRAGAYAIQGCGAALVERVEGDYLNVVGLPVSLLVRLLAKHFPGAYGYGIAPPQGESSGTRPGGTRLGV
jgi:septum formation protein